MINRKRLVLSLSLGLGLPVLLLVGILAILNKQTPQQFTTINDLMAIEDMNDTILLSYLPYMTEQSGGKMYELRNYSDSRVEFPEDFGVRIFMKPGIQERWVEIKNDMTYSTMQGGNLILAAKGSDLARRIVDINPVLPNTGEPVTIRVFVTGKVLSFLSVPGRLVAAYVDFTVQP
jgi:hypothetical protein